MENNKLISVIIPVYNVEKYLPRCLDSLLNQTYSCWEAILVDDGSIDGSGIVCDEYAAKDNRFMVVHKENGGVSSARNCGLDIMKGKYLTFIDSDDYVYESYLGDLLSCLLDEQAEIAGCYSTQENREETDHCINITDENIGSSGFVYTAWAKLYDVSCIGNLRFNLDIHYGEDTLFFTQAYLKSKKSVLICKVLYYYEKSSNGITTQRYNRRRLTLLNAYKEFQMICRSRDKLYIFFEGWYINQTILVLTLLWKERLENNRCYEIEKKIVSELRKKIGSLRYTGWRRFEKIRFYLFAILGCNYYYIWKCRIARNIESILNMKSFGYNAEHMR